MQTLKGPRGLTPSGTLARGRASPTFRLETWSGNDWRLGLWLYQPGVGSASMSHVGHQQQGLRKLSPGPLVRQQQPLGQLGPEPRGLLPAPPVPLDFIYETHVQRIIKTFKERLGGSVG